MIRSVRESSSHCVSGRTLWFVRVAMLTLSRSYVLGFCRSDAAPVCFTVPIGALPRSLDVNTGRTVVGRETPHRSAAFGCQDRYPVIGALLSSVAGPGVLVILVTAARRSAFILLDDECCGFLVYAASSRLGQVTTSPQCMGVEPQMLRPHYCHDSDRPVFQFPQFGRNTAPCLRYLCSPA